MPQNRKPPPDINMIRASLHSDLKKIKPNPEIKTQANNVSPFYQPPFVFKSSTQGPITFKISRLVRDYPHFDLPQQLSAYVKTYAAYSMLWLQSHGWGPVRIVYCDGFPGGGQINIYDPQRELRQRIISDFLCPTNATKKSLLEWKGILREQSEANARGYTIDYGVKTE